MEKIKDLLRKFMPDTRQMNTPEWLFIILLAFVVVRLAHMQLMPHEEYDMLYNRFELSENSDIKTGEIQDRGGQSLSRRALVTDIIISSFQKFEKDPDGSYKTVYVPPAIDNGEHCAESAEATLNIGFWGKSYNFTRPCYAVQYERIKKAEAFQQGFLEKHKDIKDRCPESTKGAKERRCRIPFAEYNKYQKEFEGIYDIQRISGLKFIEDQSPLDKAMSGICSAIKLGDDEMEFKGQGTIAQKKEKLKEKVQNLKLSDYKGISKLVSKLQKENKFTDTTIGDYCTNYKEPQNIKVSINPKSVLSNNNFSYYDYTELENKGKLYFSYKEHEKAGQGREKQQKLQSLLGAKYCSDVTALKTDYEQHIDMYSPVEKKQDDFPDQKSYDKYIKARNVSEKKRERMLNCMALYVHNLEKVENFFTEHSSEIKKNTDSISGLKPEYTGTFDKSSLDNFWAKISTENVHLATISTTTYYKIMPKINPSGGYYTEGVSFNRHYEYINLLDTAMMDKSGDISLYKKIKESYSKFAKEIKKKNEAGKKKFEEEKKRIENDIESKKLIKPNTEDEEKLLKAEIERLESEKKRLKDVLKNWKIIPDSYRTKPMPSDYMLAPVLGINFAGQNIMEIIEKPTESGTNAETLKNSVIYAKNREEASKKAKSIYPTSDKKNNEGKKLFAYDGERLVQYEVKKRCKIGTDGKPMNDKNGECNAYEYRPSPADWYGLSGKYYKQLKEGKNIVLTIDSDLQAKSEWLIRKKCEELKADRGIVLVQDVNNGDILAMAEYTSPYSEYTYQDKPDGSPYKRDYKQWYPGYNMNALYADYMSGSTFKPFAMAAALEKGIVRDGQRINVKYEYENKFLKHPDKEFAEEWKKIKEHHSEIPASFTLEQIIAHSSNIGTAIINYKMLENDMEMPKWHGKNVPLDWRKYTFFTQMEKFGFGRKTGLGEQIGVPEAPGIMFINRKIDDVPEPTDTAVLSDYLKTAYGQGPMQVTPVQLITAYSALVNGGRLYKPRIVQKAGEEEIPTELVRENVISPKTSAIIRKYMRAVIEDPIGTAYDVLKSYRGDKVATIGGKTGTATIILNHADKGGRLASFAAFMLDPNKKIPNESMPKYMVLVMVDQNPYGDKKGKHYGSYVAPMAQDISDYMFCRENKEHPKCQSGQTQTIQQSRPAAQRSRGQTSRRR